MSKLTYFAHLMTHQLAGDDRADSLLLAYMNTIKDDTEDPQLATLAKLKYSTSCQELPDTNRFAVFAPSSI